MGSDVTSIVRERATATSRMFWLALGAVTLLKVLILFVVLPRLQSVAPGLYNLSFQDEYADIASNLLAGRGYRADADAGETMLRLPGYVLFLAAIFAVVGRSLVAVGAFQLVVALLAGWGLYRLTLRITASDTVAVMAAMVFLLYPGTILAESRGGLELIFAACAILFLLLFYESIERFACEDFALTGAAFGLALLIKSTLAFVLPGLFIYVLLMKAPRPAATRCVLLFATASLAALLVVSPWVVRNYLITGRFIATTTLPALATWDALWMVKHSEDGRTNWQRLDDTIPELTRIASEMGLRVKPSEVPHFYSAYDEIRYYDELARRGWTELIASPHLVPKLLLYNGVGFWVEGRTPMATLLNAALVVPFLTLALAGVAFAVNARIRVGPVIVLILTYYLPHLAFFGTTRYHEPLVPFLAILAAVAIAGLWSLTGKANLLHRTPER